MKYRKILVFALIITFVFSIYYLFNNDKINYVSLGDSVAAGQTPYREIGYGYTDYIRDYLNNNNKLGSYDDYAVSGYKINDIVNDIKLNKKLSSNINIRKSLRESNLVTISIGANDFLKGMTLKDINLSNIDIYLKKIDKIGSELDKLMELITEYAKDEIILVGYYNPLPYLYKAYNTRIDLLFKKADRMYTEICDKYRCNYLSIYDLFRNNSNYLPNPFDIHPNIDGYKAIGNVFVETFLKRK